MEKSETFTNKEYSENILLLGKVVFGAFIAFFMEVSEVMVVAYTSSLTLSIAGIGKVNTVTDFKYLIQLNMIQMAHHLSCRI